MCTFAQSLSLLHSAFRRLGILSLVFAVTSWSQAATPVPFSEGVGFSFRINGVGGGILSIYAEGTASIVHSTSNATTESGMGVAWLRPGKEYKVNFQASGPSEYWLSYVVPEGYVLLVEDSVTNLTYASPGGGEYSHDYTIELRPIADISGAAFGEFQGVKMGRAISWEVGLGNLTTGRSAGRLYFKEYHLGDTPAARAKIYYSPPGNYGDVWIFKDGPSTQRLRQIALPQGVVDLVDDPAGGFWIRFFLHSQSEGSPGNPNILHGSPWKTIRVESPGANQLRITETEGSTVRVSLVTAPQPNSGAYEWLLQEGGGSGNWLRTTKHTSVSGGANTATGGNVTHSGGYRIHTFTTSGTLTVPEGNLLFDALLVAGGGGGGGTLVNGGGGGAGGGVLLRNGFTLAAGVHTITVGNGGSAGASGSNGGNTTFAGMTAIGGGGGGAYASLGSTGGSGGGSGRDHGSSSQSGSTQTSNGGGTGYGQSGGAAPHGGFGDSGGGGGAGAPGASGNQTFPPVSAVPGGGNGGAGLLSSITGSAVYYGGGGGGCSEYGNGGAGGLGGGGKGNGQDGPPTAGVNGRGGGGGAGQTGGGYNVPAQPGGSGVVIVRYQAPAYREVEVVVRTGDTGGTIVSRTKFRYENVGGWGEEVTKVFAYPAASGTEPLPLETTYAYHTDGNAKGNYRRIASVTQPNGAWIARTYYNDWNRRGQLQNEFRPFVDAPATVSLNTSTGRVATYEYGPDWTGRYTRPTLYQERVGGVLTAQTGYANDHVVGQGWPREFTNVFPWSSATANVMEHTQTYRGDAGFDYPGLPYVQKRADLSQTSFSYSHGDWNGTTFSTTSWTGYWREIAVHGTQSNSEGAQLVSSWGGQGFEPVYVIPNKSTLSVLIRRAGLPVRRETRVYTGSGEFSLLTWENFSYNDQWRLTQTTDSTGATTDYVYVGGRLDSTTDAGGIVTKFAYDALGRVLWQRKEGVSALALTLTTGYDYKAQPTLYTHFVRDALGRVRESYVTTSTTVPTTLGANDLKETATFDLAGRLTESKSYVGSAHQLTTAYNYHGPADRKTTVTFPGGATKVVETHRDGLVKQVRGDGVVHEDHSHSITSDGRYFRQSVFGNNWSAWTNSYFDWLGRPAEEWKPGWNGNAVSRTWHYNNRGQLWKITAPGVNPTLFEYDTLGAKIREGLDVNNDGTLELASSDRITETVYSLFIDGLSRATRQVTTQTYATKGNATATTTGVHTELLSNLGANVLRSFTATDIHGNHTYHSVVVDRAAKKLVTTVDHPDSTTHTISVTHNGLAVETQDFAGLRTRTEYDSLGRPEKTIVPRIAETTGIHTTAYLANTNLIDKVTDTAGFVTATYAYDSAGRVKSVKDAEEKYAYTAYTTRGEVHRQWGDTAIPVEYAYNGVGQRTTMKTYRGGTGWTQADWPGTPANNSNSPGTADTTTWHYQAATRLLASKEDADGKSVDYTYTQAGQIYTREWARFLSGSSGARVTSTYTYDTATGELTGVTYNDSTAALAYTYNRLGVTSTVTDATGTRTFNYALTGKLQLQSEDLPAYFGSRRLTWPRATTGVLGRPTGVQLGTSANPTLEQSVAWGYDAYGRFNQVTTGSIVLDYTYTTNAHLLHSISDTSSGWTQTRTYLANRDLLDVIEGKVGATSVAKFDYGHDDLGRRTTVGKTGSLYARYGNGTQGLATSWDYDDRSQVESEQTVLGGTSTALTGRTDAYAYDNFGNRASTAGTTHNSATAAYTTNALNQYTARTVPGTTDVSGAATSTTVTVSSSGGPTRTAARSGEYFFDAYPLVNTTDAVFRELTIDDGVTTPSPTTTAFVPKTPEAMTYDRDGNLTRDGRWVYVYDAENRLIAQYTRGAPEDPLRENPGVGPNRAVWDALNAAAPFGGRRLEFTYDYQGRRVAKIVKTWSGTAWTSTETRFVYDGWNLLAEYAVSGSTLTVDRSYTWGLDWSGTLQGAGGVGGLLLIQEDGATYQPHYDGNGNLMGLTTRSAVTFGSDNYAAGALVAAYEYDAFGQTLRESGPYAPNNTFRFSTKFTDLESGLVYYGLRYYSPSLGRFVNRDPIEEKGGLNLYAFVGNNGVNAWDYLGMDDFPDSTPSQYRPGNGYGYLNRGRVTSGFAMSSAILWIPDSSFAKTAAAIAAADMYSRVASDIGKLADVQQRVANGETVTVRDSSGTQMTFRPGDQVQTRGLSVSGGAITAANIGNTYIVNSATGEYSRANIGDVRALGDSIAVFENGQSNPLERAISLGAEQTGAAEFVLHHNPSHGGIMDTVESLIGKLFGSTSQATELTNLLAATSDMKVALTAHSQGGITTNIALETYLGRFGAGSLPNLSVHYNGAAVSELASRDLVASVGSTFAGPFSMNPHDPIPILAGGNIDDPIQFIDAVFRLPQAILGEKYGSTHTHYKPEPWEP